MQRLRHNDTYLLALLAVLLFIATPSAAEDAVPPTIPFDANLIAGSKHDLTALNQRAGLEAMEGVAMNDYGNPCVYCHIPAGRSTDEAEAAGTIPGWNRIRPVTTQYETYSSYSLQGKSNRPSEISMLCLSCHDGTMAVDRIAFKPAGWNSSDEATLHMKIGATSDVNHCGKCHDGDIAHDISAKAIGTDLRDDHPISIRYAGLDIDNPGFRTVDSPTGFDNGVMLYNGMVECASCHDIHNPKARMLLRVDSSVLCGTCHIK